MAHLLLSTVIIFALAYLLGHSMLTGAVKGNDSALHIAYATWLNQYLPNIPHWYPLQGGGESVLHGYPLLGHILVVILHRASDLSILQVFRLVSFLTFPLTAMGVYLFCWAALKKQTVGLLAAVFYLLAPLTWTWMYDWGFFAHSVAMIFLPPTLLCFDRYLSHILREPSSGWRRLWLAGLVLSLALASLTHPAVGAGAVAGMTLYTVTLAAMGKRGTKPRILKKGLLAVFSAGVLAALILAFYLVPFYRYGQIANREGLNLLALDQMPRLSIAEFFGLRPTNPRFVLTRMANPLVVTLFFAIGIPLSARYSRKALALILASILAAVYSLTPELAYTLTSVSSILGRVFGIRSTLVFGMVLFPVGAAYGAWALARTLVSPISLLRRRASRGMREYQPRLSLRGPATSGLALVIAGTAIVQADTVFPSDSFGVAYGPLGGGINFTDIWGQGKTHGLGLVDQLAPQNWPEIALSDQDGQIANTRRLASLLPDKELLRVDVSPYLGRLIQDLPQHSNASLIDSYTHQLSLVHLMWGYQQNVFYSIDAEGIEDGTPGTLDELAQWFGPEYVFLDPQRDPIETYQAAGWLRSYADDGVRIWLNNDRSEYLFLDPGSSPEQIGPAAGWEPIGETDPIQLWRNPEPPGMATATTRPTILVVGAPDKAVYANVFRPATEGLAPYDEFLLVEGSGQIDRYSQEELQRFDILFLHGYRYGNGRKAWDLLEEYVRGGGSLFVDTGWQFEVPEWEFDQAPQVLPVSSLTWTNYGKESNYQLGNLEIAGDVDTAQFGPLAWGEDPWSVSGASRDDLRDWGRPILSTQDHPLIVSGELGNGRVVWSGMNLIAHLISYESREESRLLHNILGWLGEGTASPDPEDPGVVRDHPDRVEFSLSTVPNDITWLYWREAVYPNWHAYLVDGDQRTEIPIYRGGPGFMLMPIETTASEANLMLQWEPALVERLAVLVSLGAAVFLIVLVLDGIFLKGQGFYRLRDFIRQSAPRPFLGDGPIHDWVERKQKEINGEDDLAPGWDWKPNPVLSSAAGTLTGKEGSSAIRGDGRDESSGQLDQGSKPSKKSTPDELESPVESEDSTKDRTSPPDWLRRLDAETGKRAGEILIRRRHRNS